MVRIYVFFELEKLANTVTSPPPFVDAAGIFCFADLVKERLTTLATGLEQLQKAGYSLRLAGARSVTAQNDDRYTHSEAHEDLVKAGINKDDCSIQCI